MTEETLTGTELLEMGWSQGKVIGLLLTAVQNHPDSADQLRTILDDVRQNPKRYLDDPYFEPVARELLNQRYNEEQRILRQTPVPHPSWGREMIDSGAIKQMEQAARLPISVAGALMPDAHVGYGLPIGGVLATQGAVIPYAVGVDIACRMRLSICELSPHMLDKKTDRFSKALMENTRFGMGAQWERHLVPEHPVLESEAWDDIPWLQRLQHKASIQLGTSGGGNHFVEWGVLEVLEEEATDLGLTAGKYLALLSHSGSRGLGANIADHYTKIAMNKHSKLEKSYRHLAWLDLDSNDGLEYWQAMTLAGQYASANHAIIHERVLAGAGLEPIAHVENHHNYAWKEQLADGTEVIVHRKGATPAGAGVLGVIPGSMGDPGYVIRGKGNLDSINSASHGAGRKMSRKQAFDKLSATDWEKYLRKRNVTLLGGSLDESPQAYKNIDEVMAAQDDLVQIVARFTPRIVRMAELQSRGHRRRKKKGKRN